MAASLEEFEGHLDGGVMMESERIMEQKASNKAVQATPTSAAVLSLIRRLVHAADAASPDLIR